MADTNDFAARLRDWRQRRRHSQLDLSLRAGLSQRHLSFLELGRARPSREMVLRLAEALDVPLRQQNAWLLAAGFAPAWPESALGDRRLAGVSEALDHMLAQQEPYPGVAVDRHWNLLRANQGAQRLVEFLVGPLPAGARVNLADALVGPNLLRPYLANWHDVVRHFLRSVEADAAADDRPETAALLDRLLAYEGVRDVLAGGPTGTAGATPVLPLHFRKGEVALRLFTTIATLGTPQDIALEELRIESFFPIDAATAATLRGWA